MHDFFVWSAVLCGMLLLVWLVSIYAIRQMEQEHEKRRKDRVEQRSRKP